MARPSTPPRQATPAPAAAPAAAAPRRRASPRPRRRVLPCLALMALAMAAVIARDPAGEAVCPRLPSPLQLDGRLDDAAWTQAAATGRLVTLGAQAEPARDTTTWRCAHDDEAIVIAVDCHAERAAGPPGPAAHDDPAVLSRDHVELLLQTDPANPADILLAIDRFGATLDAWPQQPAADPGRGVDGQGAWQAHTAETDHGWSAEIRLPFRDLTGAPPRPGDLWRFRVARVAGRDGTLAWPPNPTEDRRAEVAQGALYLTTTNLIRNGTFTTAGEAIPAPWLAALTSPEVNNAPQGTIEAIPRTDTPGQNAIRLTKLAQALWWPQLWNTDYALIPGATYELSAVASGTLPAVNLRANTRGQGRLAKLSGSRELSATPTRVAFRFTVPALTEKTDIGFSAPAGTGGEAVLADVVLRRVLHGDDTTASAPAALTPPDYSPDPDPFHGLAALTERAGTKPWEHHWRDGALLSHRTIFRDRRYGTPLWLLDHSPSSQVGITASIWPGWNENGSRLLLGGLRRAPDGTPKRWIANADLSALTPMPPGGMPLWDRDQPDVCYRHEPGMLTRLDLATGEQRLVASWTPRDRERAYGLTRDNRAVFVTDHDGGQWVPYRPGEPPVPAIKVLDCYGQGPDGRSVLPSLMAVTQDDSGPLFRILVGTRIDTRDGSQRRLVLPISGHLDYLRTFASGRVRFPDDAEAPATRDLDELFALYNLYPSCSHGHLSYSPDGEYVCWDGLATSYRVRDHGDRHEAPITSNGHVYHTCWFYDPRFYITCVRAYRTDYDRADRGGQITQVFSDGTWQPVCDIKMRPAAFYYQGNFATLSRDATKIHYASSMTGLPKNYIAVLARPQPPRALRWRRDGRAITLTWQAPPHHREVRGYVVYRGSPAGLDLVTRSAQPVTATSWQDPDPQPGTAYAYAVTTLEYSGLESGFSNLATPAGVDLDPATSWPVVLFAEAEDALADLATGDRPGLSCGRDWLTASNGYFLYRTPKANTGQATLTIDVPTPGRYHLWLRTRSSSPAPAEWTAAAPGLAPTTLPCTSTEWAWQRAATTLDIAAAGTLALALSTTSPTAQADLACLTTDPAFTPAGTRPEDRQPPDTVRGLQAEPIGDRGIRLTWTASTDADLDHYQVYAAREAFTTPDVARLIASPTRPELIDWGLRPDAAYHYAITAVDRRGNESTLSTVVSARTAPRPHPVQHHALTADQARRGGPIQTAQGTGTLGNAFAILPETASAADAADASLSWEVTIDHDAAFYLWLRYLPRGQASARNAALKQAVQLLVDGQPVALVAAGATDLSAPDSNLRPEFWTWSPPLTDDLVPTALPAGRHTLTLQNLTPGIRYDALILTDEPSFQPDNGRLRQNPAL